MYGDIPLCRQFPKAVRALAVLLLLAPPAWGQQRASAGLYGGIFDPTGAVILGAKNSLVQLATKQLTNAVSNGVGEYVFPLLPVGEYRLLVEHLRFKKYEETGLLLQANDNIKVDVRLEIGKTTTQVTVEPVPVETNNATLMATVDSKRVVDLPLNGRNLADLTLLVPGVQSTRGPDTDYNNANMTFLFPDAVHEFSIQVSNARLNIEKSSAGAVNIIARSGTNEFHGDVFWFIHNTELNDNSFFSRFGLKRSQFAGLMMDPKFTRQDTGDVVPAIRKVYRSVVGA